MNFYPHHIGDYRRRTVHLSLAEHGIYRQFLDTYLLDEGPLCADEAILMRTHCVRTPDEEQAMRNVLRDFFVLTPEGWTHKDCEATISAYRDKSDKARASANKRWSGNHDANAMPTHSEGNANQEPRTNNQEPRTPKASAPASPLPSVGFEEFWQAYPKQIGRGAAETAWKKAEINGELPAVLAAIASQARSEQWTKDGGKYIPNPATWINQKRWLDAGMTAAAAPPVKLCTNCGKAPSTVDSRGGLCMPCWDKR